MDSPMKHSPLMSDQTLFRDPDLFDFDHPPEEFNYRDTQMNDLALALRPAVQGFSPLNTVLRGPPGTGKTTAVRRIFAEVEEATQRIVVVLVCLSRSPDGLSGHRRDPLVLSP